MFMDGSYIHYTYDAAGTLLRKGYFVNEELTEIPGDDEEELTGFRLPDTHLMSVGDEEEEKELVEEEEEIPYTDVIDYCGNCIYENGTLKTILIEDGYITFDSNSQPVYHFYLQDHLGNNRVVANASGEVEQVNHYYPYGGLMAESTFGDVQRYKYNGKELDRMLGLDWFDYGARHYDGALTTWGTVDPLCEKYYGISPYVYCGNNPINAFDPDGRKVIPAHVTSNGTTYYRSPTEFRQAMIVFGKTTFGRQILADFTPKGSTVFGVKGNGRYSDYDLYIHEFDYTNLGEQAAMLSNGVEIVNGQTQLNSTNENKPRFDVIIDAQLGTYELLETICHEFCIHLSIYSEVLEKYIKTGDFHDVRKEWNKESGKQQHKDLLKAERSKLKGTGNYYNTVNELMKIFPDFKKYIDQKLDFYEKEYNY